jgi:uncharacterized repeat protein (TIGR01451 family)
MRSLRTTIRALLTAPLAIALPFGVTHAAPQYIITDLGTLGGQLGSARGINETAQVVGVSSTPSNKTLQAFIWHSGTGMINLPTLGGTHALALGINNSGLVAGVSQVSGDVARRAVVWKAGAAQELPTLGGSESRALAANDSGVVTGAASTAGDTNEHAFVWQQSTPNAAVDLGTLGGASSQGSDINRSGQIVGYADVANGATHAALWAPPYSANPTDLGTLGGTYSEAFAVNAAGQVTGVSSNPGDTQFRGFLWEPGKGMVDLGALTSTSTDTAGLDINSAGDVVGYSSSGGGAARRAILRKAGAALADLNGLVLPNQGWIFSEARSINDAGQIVGIGTLTKIDTAVNVNRVEQHAFMLTPDRELPVITCPAAIKTAGAQPATLGQATATDNLSTTTDIAITSSPALPFIFPNGDTTVTWTAKDAAGNAATCTQLVTIAADTTPPVVAPRWTPANPDGANGWYITAPSLAWSVTDAESAITSRVGCVASTLSADTAGQSFDCSATSTGGTTGPVTTTVKLDRVAPSLTAPAAVTADTTAFEAATVSFASPTASDSLSGVDTASLNCSPASGSTFKLGANTVTCNAKDLAGNAATPASFTVTVRDPSAPVVTPTVTGPQGSAGWYKGPVTVSFAVSDAQSTITAKDPACDTPTTLSGDGANQLVTCSATSAGGTTNSAQSVNVDATPPNLGISPTTLVVEADRATGAMVIYPRTMSDATSGPATRSATCSPASNTVMPLGSTTVNCSGADLAGNTATGSFVVTVADTTAPTLTVPTGAAASTTDGAGTAVSYAVSASDVVDVAVTPVCSPASGSLFPIGTTTVSCTATDAHGNSASKSFPVTVSLLTGPVTDLVAPVLSLPADPVTATATDANGVVVNYVASATDAVDGSVPVSCAPASGSLFPVGDTLVNCSASDLSGNVASGSFTVRVSPPVTTLPTADLAVSVTERSGKREARLNRNFTYTFTVRNSGPGVSQATTFTDTLPSSLRIVSVAPSVGTCTAPINSNGGTVTCNLGNVNSGQAPTVRITVTPLVGTGTIPNTGSAATGSNDPNTANNSASITMNACT